MTGRLSKSILFSCF